MSQTAVVTHQKAIRKDNPVMKVIGRVLLYTVLIAMALFTLIPFVWMLSSSLKLDQEVFQYPIRWIPETFHWENYRVIWERVSLADVLQEHGDYRAGSDVSANADVLFCGVCVCKAAL